MRSIIKTSNTTIIRYENNEEFKKMNKKVNRYCLHVLTYHNNCVSACSYIYPETKIERSFKGTHIYDLVVYSDSSCTSVHHKKLKVYWSENGGYYAKTRFGRAWLNSFFGIPRNGEYERILSGSEVIKNEKLNTN